MIWDILLDSLIDTAKVLPIIFVVYVLIEFIESREGRYGKLEKAFSGRLAPLYGAGIGLIPQCGFSVVATKLFQDGYIYMGTLIAVYLATSDEALPIMFSRAVTEPTLWISLLIILAIKFVYATFCGYMINLTQKSPARAFDE
ncbi:MAG: arsenic efflux protein, partial [Clostridia bacterium]|nr:arsenic efflux protein [Clostridia bacterium]